jgi:adenylate cyclase
MAEQRKLVTIMALDVAGYSRASEKDDSAMVAAVGRLRTVIAKEIAPHGGRIFNTAGDGFMIEFSSAISAVATTQELLEAIAEENLPAVRIGLHLGDVILSTNDDLLGHGVNVAARLMALAAPGTVVLSAPVQIQLNETIRSTLRPLGRVQLDKMGTRIDAYAIAPKHVRFTRVRWKRARRWVFPAAAIVMLAAVALTAWFVFAAHAIKIPRLAILRFQNLGNTEPYFAEGIADELINELSRVPGMEVTARASSFALTGDNATPEQAARKLGATLLLTGSVRHLANTIRVNAELVAAPSGRSLWARAFEHPANEAFALQRDIAIRVAKEADARVTAPPPPNIDAEAYRLYLQGRDLQLGKTTQDWAGVRDLYRAAVERDPNFAKAWAQLANAEANVASDAVNKAPAGTSFTDAILAPSLAAADHAIALDNHDPQPFLVRSMINTWLGHWQLAADASAEAERRGAHNGVFYRALGYMQKAEDARRQSTSLNPLSASDWNNYAYTCEYNEDAASQLDAAQRAHELAPKDVSATRGLARALIANNRGDETYALIKEAGWIKDSSLSVATRQLLWMAGHGEPVPTDEIVAGLKAGTQYIDTAVGFIADAQRWDDAASLLDRWDASARSTLFTLMRKQWAPLRTKPQFWALMQREGLVKYWHDSGQWPDFCNSEPVCQQYR